MNLHNASPPPEIGRIRPSHLDVLFFMQKHLDKFNISPHIACMDTITTVITDTPPVAAKKTRGRKRSRQPHDFTLLTVRRPWFTLFKYRILPLTGEQQNEAAARLIRQEFERLHGRPPVEVDFLPPTLLQIPD